MSRALVLVLTAYAVMASPASALAVAAKPLPGLTQTVVDRDFPKTAGVLVLKHGTLLYETYFGAGTPTLLNDTRSATKSITALAVGAAIADGAIRSVDAPAFSFLSDLAPFANDGPSKRAITLRDLLTMSSALACDDDDDKSPGNEDRMHEQKNWARWAVDLPVKADYRRDLSGLGPWSYCTAGAFLMGQIVQRAVHQPVDKYIERRILQPLGIAHWEWPYSPSGETMTGGGLKLTARDLAKLAVLVTENGRYQGKEIIPASFIADMTRAHRTAYGDHGYGYFYWQYNYRAPCGPVSGWYMAGNGGNAIVSFKSLDAAAVIARQNYSTKGMHAQTQALIEAYVLPALCPAPAH